MSASKTSQANPMAGNPLTKFRTSRSGRWKSKNRQRPSLQDVNNMWSTQSYRQYQPKPTWMSIFSQPQAQQQQQQRRTVPENWEFYPGQPIPIGAQKHPAPTRASVTSPQPPIANNIYVAPPTPPKRREKPVPSARGTSKEAAEKQHMAEIMQTLSMLDDAVESQPKRRAPQAPQPPPATTQPTTQPPQQKQQQYDKRSDFNAANFQDKFADVEEVDVTHF